MICYKNIMRNVVDVDIAWWDKKNVETVKK